MMRTIRYVMAGPLAAALAILPACGGSGPTNTIGFFVGGQWIQVSTLVSNTCPEDPENPLPTTETSNLTIQQSGTALAATFVFPDGTTLIVTGTLNPDTGDFSLSITVPTQDGGTVTYVQIGQFSSEDAFTSESTLTIAAFGDSCEVRGSEVGTRS